MISSQRVAALILRITQNLKLTKVTQLGWVGDGGLWGGFWVGAGGFFVGVEGGVFF